MRVALKIMGPFGYRLYYGTQCLGVPKKGTLILGIGNYPKLCPKVLACHRIASLGGEALLPRARTVTVAVFARSPKAN